jgi:hypothetical protein
MQFPMATVKKNALYLYLQQLNTCRNLQLLTDTFQVLAIFEELGLWLLIRCYSNAQVTRCSLIANYFISI